MLLLVSANFHRKVFSLLFLVFFQQVEKKYGGHKWSIDRSFCVFAGDKIASNFALNAKSGLIPNSGNLEETNLVGAINTSAKKVRYGGKR